MFNEYGLVQAIIDSKRFSDTKVNNLEDIATEDAIECGAEEIEIDDIDISSINVGI